MGETVHFRKKLSRMDTRPATGETGSRLKIRILYAVKPMEINSK
jgi:hypothetical protein